MDISFDPPSDYAAEGDSGGSAGKILLWIGGGCFLFAIILGAALAFGLYEGVTCCKDLVEQQSRARAEATDFAQDLSDANYPRAWSRLTPTYQDQTTFSAFRERMEPWSERIAGREVDVFDVHRQMNAARSFWELKLRFSTSGDDNVVVMTLELEELDQKNDAGQAQLGVDRVAFRLAERAQAAEAPAKSVLEFNRLVRQGDWEGVQRYLGAGYGDPKSLAAFRDFIEGQGALFSEGEVDIERVDTGRGARQDGRASVIAAHERSGGRNVEVRYTLKRTAQRRWVITGVAPMIEQGADAAVQRDADSMQAADAGDAR